MKQVSKLLCFLFLTISVSCHNNDEIRISIINQSEINDSLFVRNLITKELVFTLPFSVSDTLIQLNESLIVSYATSGSSEKDIHLGILLPDSEKSIRIDKNGEIKSHNTADSLLHYLYTSNNVFIGEHQNYIFGAENPKDVYLLFESFLTKRDSVINSYERTLTSAEREILNFQNAARIYSFLFYYGRLIKNLSPDNSYWNYIGHIDNNSTLNKFLPNNLLYKYEIEYLKEHDELESIADFIDYIQLHTTNNDLTNYLIAIYIKELISNPYYWEKHDKLFESVSFLNILDKQAHNPYNEMYKRTVDMQFASQKGVEAYNFTATNSDGHTIKLSDFAGKIVLIDVWATWCGPCITQKPYFYELASMYKDKDDIRFIAISVDASIDTWKDYLSKNPGNEKVLELYVHNGMKTEFGEKYQINFVPKYILIDREGKIINANAPNPSKQLEMMLDDL